MVDYGILFFVIRGILSDLDEWFNKDVYYD